MEPIVTFNDDGTVEIQENITISIDSTTPFNGFRGPISDANISAVSTVTLEAVLAEHNQNIANLRADPTNTALQLELEFSKAKLSLATSNAELGHGFGGLFTPHREAFEARIALSELTESMERSGFSAEQKLTVIGAIKDYLANKEVNKKLNFDTLDEALAALASEVPEISMLDDLQCFPAVSDVSAYGSK